MKKIIIILVLVLVFLGGYFYFNNTRQEANILIQDNQSNISIDSTDEIKTEEQGSVLPTNSTLKPERKPSRYACVGEFCDGSGSGDPVSSYTVLQIPLIKEGGNIGCGVSVFFAPHVVPKTEAVLDATYRLLFDIKATPEIPEDGFQNVVGAYSRLYYDSVSIKDGTAKLMLSGQMYGPGHCAVPAFNAQINQAAFQFDTVKKLEVYLNGSLFDFCSISDADVSESKCDKIPQYWIATK